MSTEKDVKSPDTEEGKEGTTVTPGTTKEPEKEVPKVIPFEKDGPTPGTGIDTDGDGDANKVVGPEKPKDAAKPFDYAGKIRLSDQHYDAVNITTAKRLINKSHIYPEYKKNLLQQIKDGKIEPQYAHMLRRIIEADSKGSIYSGTLEG